MYVVGRPKSANVQDHRADGPALSGEDEQLLMDLGYIIGPSSDIGPDGMYKQLGNSQEQIEEARKLFPVNPVEEMMNITGQRRYPSGR